MAGTPIASVADLLNSTLARIEKENAKQTYKYHEYGLTNFLFGRNPGSDSGSKLAFDVRVRASDSSRFVGLYESTPNTQKDLMVKGYEPWSHNETKMQYEEKEEAMNSGAAKIYDMIKQRWHACIEDNFNLMEDTLPFAPATSGVQKPIRGLLYHVRTLGVGVTDTAGGFNGQTVIYGDGSTDNTWCDLDRTVAENSRLRNWVATWNGAVDQGLLKLLRRAMRRTGFKSLPGIKDPDGNPQAGLVLSSDLLEEYEDLVSRRSVAADGGDAAPVNDNLKIRGAELIECPPLNDVAYTPIIGLRRPHIKATILGGRWMKRKEPINDKHQVESWTVAMVSSAAIECSNPRGLFVVHQPRVS